MEPSKGRIVNYHCIKGEEYLGCGEDMVLPAIITRVHPNSPMKAVDVTIFTCQPSAPLVIRTSISHGLTNGGGWSWPSIKKDGYVDKVTGNEPASIDTASIPAVEQVAPDNPPPVISSTPIKTQAAAQNIGSPKGPSLPTLPKVG